LKPSQRTIPFLFTAVGTISGCASERADSSGAPVALSQPDAAAQDGATDSAEVSPHANSSGGGTGPDAGRVDGHAQPKGTPCTEPTHPYEPDGYTLDLGSTTPLLACVYGGQGRRVDLEGSGPVCPNLSDPCNKDGEPCTHDCITDGDCSPGNVCVCHAVGVASTPGVGIALAGEGPNRCVPAECTSSADCGGWACGMSEGLREEVN
jgi:hypothetical protein